jgi:multimeric flavodoxin WrbA
LKSPAIRRGQAPPKIADDEFRERFMEKFRDPAFAVEQAALERLCAIALTAYREGRKAPVTRPAGAEFADPKQELSVEWLAARARLQRAEAERKRADLPSRVLLVLGAGRNDGTCPSEMSKTFRLGQFVKDVLAAERDCDVDTLDLSLLASEYERRIYPCKGCVSTAMPLCHWPCSCYPNHSLGQTNDAMNDIYERWVRAHAILLITPVYWYQVPGGLKAMIDRLVCADGGNPDPTTTSGKNPEKAKQLELAGWPYPQHLRGRAFGVIVHGDVAGSEGVRRSLTDWLSWMGLIPAGNAALLDRFIGYYAPYATSHDELDGDHALHEETRNVARAVAECARLLRRGLYRQSDSGLDRPRPK